MTLKDKTEFILREYPKSRNSDKLLWLGVLYEFFGCKNKIKFSVVMKKDFPTQNDISRYRAYFNASGQYLPTSEKIIRMRRLKEKIMCEEMRTLSAECQHP